jgi:hypothetical protein
LIYPFASRVSFGVGQEYLWSFAAKECGFHTAAHHWWSMPFKHVSVWARFNFDIVHIAPRSAPLKPSFIASFPSGVVITLFIG